MYSSKPDNCWFDAVVHLATGHCSRVCKIILVRIGTIILGDTGEIPALTHLFLECFDSGSNSSRWSLGWIRPLPATSYVTVRCIPFPALPNLLLSATDLVDPELWNIPYFEYIPPEEFVTCLAVLTNLESLVIGVESPSSRVDSEIRRRPPLTRFVLPALIFLGFEGINEYLEDFVSRIDAPLLDNICIKFFGQPVFDSQQLDQFIGRTPKLKSFRH